VHQIHGVSWGESFGVLKQANFRWFFLARLVNLVGSLMAPIALAFAVLDIEDSASALGYVLAARSIPLVVFLLIGGVIADRFSRTAVMQWSNVLSALTQGTVALLVISGHAELWQVIALEAVNGTVSAVGFPAMASVTPQLVDRKDLQSANVLLSMSRGALAVVGPSVAALLVVTIGSGWALGIDAATWLVSALMLRRVRIPPPQRAEGEHPAGVIREIKEGWSLFVGTTWLWVVVVAFGLLNAIHAGAWYTLGPALAKDTFGPRGWGFVVSAEAVGLLAMTFVLLRVKFTRPLRAGMIGCLLFSGPLLMLGLDPKVGPLVVAAFLAGAGIEVFGLAWNLAMQENIDEGMLSRAYSYDALGSFVAIPIGQLLYGPLGEWFGYRPVLVTSAFLYAGIVLLTLSSRSVRTLSRVTNPGPAN
jgi:MFS family permease